MPIHPTDTFVKLIDMGQEFVDSSVRFRLQWASAADKQPYLETLGQFEDDINRYKTAGESLPKNYGPARDAINLESKL